MQNKILIIGSGGQIGTELSEALSEKYGHENVIISDLKPPHASQNQLKYYELNALDKDAICKIIIEEQITQIYLMAAMLSATAEKYPAKGWELNMVSLLNILELAHELKINKVFWPSSIAIFGSTTPAHLTPQKTIIEPSTIYGISKFSGELWCKYYFEKFDVDVRSIRYPGIISWKSLPGGGTTDYAVDIYYKAISEKKYTCFLHEDRMLPMMYMPDAIKATLSIMDAPKASIKNRMSYNISSMSFNPHMLFQAIQKEIPDFEINYSIDYRDEIAQTWPQSINDDDARKDWEWQDSFDIDSMTKDMLLNLSEKINHSE